jgi:katanin p60 ATPase-containing subunit A1
MVLATTNCPWDLDEAMRRRLEKRIYIPLPDDSARLALLSICLRDIPLSEEVSMAQLASLTSDGYSGADIHVVCREAAMMPMRRLLSVLKPHQVQALRQEGQLLVPKVTMGDLRAAFEKTRPSVARETSTRYEVWQQEFGST